MPLIVCPTCQARVSDRAPTCPQCGEPLRRSRPDVTRGGDAALILAALIVGVPLGLWAAYYASIWGASEGWTTGWGLIGLAVPIGLALLWSNRRR
jgi:uncharacterized paraquat-inducible protein A